MMTCYLYNYIKLASYANNNPVTFPYKNDTRRTPFDPMPDMLNILTRSAGILMDILGCENDGKSKESMIVIRPS